MSSSYVPLVTLVSYCSRERVFGRRVVENARKFSDLVVVSVGTRLYTGEPEDVEGERARLVSDAEVAPDGTTGLSAVHLIAYDVTEEGLRAPIAMHNLAREAGLHVARTAFGGSIRPFWVLMLDGDEVPDGDRFREWWRSPTGDAVRSDPRAVHKLANYWMFLHPRIVADVHEDSILLVHSDALLDRGSLSHARERDGVYLWHLTSGSVAAWNDLRVERRVLGVDGRPMFWHFSWVRPPTDGDGGRAALKAKVANWGHRDDHDWAAMIDAEFDRLASGLRPERDFVHGYRLTVVEPGKDAVIDDIALTF